jgi:hypothetical protein
LENKNNISKEDFLKLFDSNEPKDLEHLDDFEKEALEGLKMMKNPSIVNSIDAKIDTKLAELVAAEKKGGKRAGMYFLSIAASIALVIGLFFIFKQSEPSIKNEVAEVKEQEVKKANDVTGAITDEEPKLDSDGKIVTEQNPVSNEKQVPGNSLGPVEEKSLETIAFAENGKDLALQKGNTKYEVKKEAEGYIADDRKEIVATPPVMAGEVMNDESMVYNSKDKDANLDLEEKVVVTDNIKLAETNSKKDEDLKSKASKKTAETKNRAVAPAENVAPNVSQTIVGTNNNTNTNNNTTTFTNTAGSGVIANTTISANSTNTNKPTTYVVSEFVGGKKALDEYIKKNLKIPATCPAEEIVIVKFSIDASGKISKPKIESKTGNCADCEKEALNFVKNMPNWKAATQDGKAIASKQQVVLSFKK